MRLKLVFPPPERFIALIECNRPNWKVNRVHILATAAVYWYNNSHLIWCDQIRHKAIPLLQMTVGANEHAN